MEGKRQRKDSDETRTTAVSTADSSQAQVLSKASSSSTAAAATQAQRESQTQSPGLSQGPSQAQGSATAKERLQGHGAMHYEVGPSPARAGRPSPSKPTFGISQPAHLQANSRVRVQRLVLGTTKATEQQVSGSVSPIHAQAVVVAKPVPVPASFGPKTKIQGIDPGLVTMASGVSSDQKPLFAFINRFQALQGHEETVRHGMDDDAAFQMTAKIVNAAVNTQTSPTNSAKKKQKKRVKSKCRLRRFYGKQCSQHRRQMQGRSFLTLTGNWQGVSTYMKSHTRRSMKL